MVLEFSKTKFIDYTVKLMAQNLSKWLKVNQVGFCISDL